MKSPKEILLEPAVEAAPALDRIRARVVTELTSSARQRPTLAGFFTEAWDQLFWQSRNIWGALAAVWVALFVIAGTQNRALPTTNQTARPVIPARPTWERHHNALLAELGLSIEPRTEKRKPKKPAAIHQSRFRTRQTYA